MDMQACVATKLAVWEQAEIDRSEREAKHTPIARLTPSRFDIERYMAPAFETPFPLEYAYALLGDVRGRTVLDLGCGSGENSLLLAHRGAHVVGVDISPSLVALARRRFALNGCRGLPADFLVGSAHRLPLPDASVDVVFGVAVLHHLDLAAASREVHRVLRPGGRAIFQEPVRDSAVVRAVRRCIPYRSPDVSPFEHPLTMRELVAFSKPFRTSGARAFGLPHVAISQRLPLAWRWTAAAYRLDAWALTRSRWLSPLASIRVFQLGK